MVPLRRILLFHVLRWGLLLFLEHLLHLPTAEKLPVAQQALGPAASAQVLRVACPLPREGGGLQLLWSLPPLR